MTTQPKSETPRTDHEAKFTGLDGKDGYVPADFARQLERECERLRKVIRVAQFEAEFIAGYAQEMKLTAVLGKAQKISAAIDEARKATLPWCDCPVGLCRGTRILAVRCKNIRSGTADIEHKT